MRAHRFALACACFLALAATPAAAQYLPGIYISPPDGYQATAQLVPVQITWTHASYLIQGSRSIKLNGNEVKDDFSYAPAPQGPDEPALAFSRDTVSLTPGENILTAYICGGSGSVDCATETITLYYTAPPPPGNQEAPRLSFAPHSETFADFTAEAATASYSAPGYVSLGEQRALTLVYSSELAEPRPFVQLDVQDPSLVPASKFSIRARLAGTTTWSTLTSGLTETFYSNTGGTTNGISRLAVQLPLDALGGTPASGVYRVEVQVTSHWASGTPRSTLDTADVLVLSRRQSPYGTGWGVQGLQQAFPSAAGVLMDEGDGTASFFRQSGGNYVSPPGDPSSLSWAVGDSLVRTYPDGTRTVFGPVLPNSAPATRLHLYTATRLGQRVSYSYDAAGRLATVTDPAGRETALAYQANAAGTVLLRSVTSPGGRQLLVQRDSTNTIFYDADGVQGLRQTHSTSGRQSVLYPRTGGAWTTTYNAFGNLLLLYTPSITADGAWVRLITRFTRPREAVLPAANRGTSAAPLPRVLPDAPHTRIVGPRGDTTRVWSDRFGLPTRVIAPLGDTVEVERDAEGRPTRIVQDGDTTLVSYNADGTVRSSYDQAHEQMVNHVYEQLGGATFLRGTSQAGTDVTYHRGTLGQVDSIRVENLTVARFTYDADFQVRTATDAKGHTTEYFYDGNPWRNVDSVRVVTPTERQRASSTYDAYGRTSTVTDPLGRTTAFTYDERDRVTKQRAPGDSLTYRYGTHGLTAVIDALGREYGFVRNPMGWVDREVDPNGRHTVYTYDRGGNVTSVTDRTGRIFRSTYDLLNRQTLFVSAEGDTTRYGYDDPGKGWTWVRNAESADTLVYERRGGRLMHHHASMGGQRYEMNSDYDGAGRRNSLVTLRGTWWAPVWRDSTAYSYDDMGRLTSVLNPLNGATGVTYDNDGLPTNLYYPASAAR